MTTIAFHGNARSAEHWNDVFEAISVEPRRQLAIALLDAAPGESVALPEAAMSPSIPVDRDELRLALIHCHLPKLAGNGFIRWHDEPLRAIRGPRFEEIAAVFEALGAAIDSLPDQLVVGYR